YNSGDDYRTSLLRKLMACLILKYQLPDYYIDSDSYPVLSGNFPHVLADIVAQGEREVIYIDGLDQLTTQSTIEQGLGFLPARLPPGIVIVLGTRPNDTWEQLKRAIGAPDDDPYLLGMLSRADFGLLLPPRDEPLAPALVERFYTAMQGNALYLNLLAQELKVDHDSFPEELIAQVENNPNSIFTFTFARMRQPDTEWHGVIRPLLGALLVAREALTYQQLGQICSVESYRIKDATTRLGGLLTHLSNERYTLFHRKLYEYLREDIDHPEDEYEFDLAEERQWHSKLAHWCGQGSNELLWSEGVDPFDQEDYREYARKHYVTHLHYARDYPRLFTVLDDGEYERGKLHADPSTRSTVLDLMVGCEDAARAVTTRREGDASLATGLSALARLWRYTLLRCSLETQADAYPMEAFQALLALNRERQALDLAELLTQPTRKVAALILVMQHLLAQPTRTAEGLQLYDRVYEVAGSIAESNQRVRAFGHLAASLQRANQEEKADACWQEANMAVDTITDSHERAESLRNLAEAYIQAHMWEQAQTTASMIDGTHEQIEAWGSLMLALRRAGLMEQADRVYAEMQTLASGSTEQAELDKVVQARAQSLSALALAQAGQVEEARRLAGKIRISTERDITFVRIDAELAIASADAWEHSWDRIDTIVQKYVRSGHALAQLNDMLVDLSIELARQARWEQARTVAMVMSNKEVRCRALMGIVGQRALHGQSKEAEDSWNEARTLCTAQLDMVEARVAGIVVSALVKAGLVTQAREIASGIADIPIREHVMSEFAIALAGVKQIEDAKTLADSIINLQDKDHAYSGIALALMESGESEQAQTVVSAINDRNRRWHVSGELVTICCDMQQWETAQTIADLIDDPNLQAEARSRIISGLVREGQSKEAEALVSSITREYFKLSAICDLASTFAQIGARRLAAKYIRVLGTNKEIQKIAECNDYIAVNWLAGAESTAKAIAEGSEQREALCNVAIAYARSQSWDKAEEVVDMIHDRETQDEAREVVAVELARAGQWERAVTTLDEIAQNSGRRTVILQTWGTLLAQPGSREQREKIEHHLNESKEKAGLLVSVADTLAQAGQYTEQLQVVQHAWLQASTKDDCLNLFAAVQGLILRAPEMGPAFHDAFTWVDAFLSE
nr:hypothetical protein [Chloroflexota bacterium]